jgi:hypothetical protein
MRQYVFVRTDKRYPKFMFEELKAGRLRQGWGWKPEHDLRLLAGKSSRSAEEASVWRNRRLLEAQPSGLQPGDIVIVPNLPEQGRWVLARVAEGGYRFERTTPEDGVGIDYGHIVPVRLLERPDGSPGIVEADNAWVDARLRASVRNLSRMWSVDGLARQIDALISAIESGRDTTTPQTHSAKFDVLVDATQRATWEAIRAQYKAAELEHLVLRVLQGVYADGDVQHWGGAGEKGADLIVTSRDPLGLEFRIGVQVKMHLGVDDDLHSLEQIKVAAKYHRLDAGIVVTTAQSVTERFETRREALEAELGIDIRVMLRDEFLKLVLRHAGGVALLQATDAEAVVSNS